MAPARPSSRRPPGRPGVRRGDDRQLGADEYAAVAPAIAVHNHDAMSANHIVALQQTVGNKVVARLLAVQRDNTSELTEHAAEHVNVIDSVHELRRAIDQTEVNDKDNTRKVEFKIVDRVLANLSPSQIAAIKTEYLNETRHDLVEDLLGEKVYTEYTTPPRDIKPKVLGGHKERETTMRTIVVRSTLTQTERARVRALLAGTALEPMGATSAAAQAGEVPVTEMSTALPGEKSKTDAFGKTYWDMTPDEVTTRKLKSLPDKDAPPGTLSEAALVVRRNRAAADAAELKLLLEAKDEPSTQRIMQVLRKSAASNDFISAMYKTLFNAELETELVALNGRKLLGIGYQDGDRALALRYGIWNRADALALLGMSRAISALDDMLGSDILRTAEKMTSLSPGAKVPVLGDAAKQRKKLLTQMERLLATVGSEAAAETGGGRAAMAIRLQALMAVNVAGENLPPVNLETAMAGMLPPADLAVVKAMVGGDPVDEAVARLTRASEGDTLDPKEVSDVLRGIRAKAEAEVRHEAKEETETLKAAKIPAEQVLSALELIQQKAMQEIDTRAKRYINSTIARFDQLADAKGPGQAHFKALVDAAVHQRDKTLIDQLIAEGGKPKPVDELVYAMDKPDLMAAASILRALPVPARRAVVAEYDEIQKLSPWGHPLAEQVAGKMKTRAAYRGPGKVSTGEHERRTDEEAAVAELINAPEPGGESELSWTFKWTRDTYDRAIAEGGMAGRIGDTTIGGVREVRQILDDSADQLLDAMNEFRNATTPEAKTAALLKARDARAAMSVDKNAYVAATDALRASIANAVAIAVDIALTFAVPGVGGVVAHAVMSLAVNIATKVAILGDQYNSEMLTGDIVGAVVGMGFGVPSKLAGEGAAKIVGRRLASAATELGYVISPELRAFAAAATRIAGQAAETAGSTAATNVALGKDATEGMGLAFVVAGVKLHMIPMIKGPATAGTRSGTADSDEPTAGSPRRGTPDDEAVPVDDADIIEETPMALPEPGSTTKVGPAPAPVRKRAVGESAVLGDNEVEAWKVYKKWRTDDPSREVALMYNHAEKKWAVVQGSGDKVDTIAAAKALGWDPKETMVLGRHSHPPDRSGVTEPENLQPSGRQADLDMIKADANKVDSGDGVHWSAIDVTTQHGSDTVYVFYDRKSGVFTVRSPNPAAGPGQYEWHSFPNITYYHGWYRNRFGAEPSSVKLFGQQGGAPTAGEPSAGTPKKTSSGDFLDEQGKVERKSSPTHYEATENFGDPHPHVPGETEARYHASADLEAGGVMSADFRLRRMDLPGHEGEYHRSTLRGEAEFKAALEHFRRQDPDAVKAIKANWNEGDNADAFNLAYIEARQAGQTHQDAMMTAASKPKTAEWAAAEGFTRIEIETAVQDKQSGLFDHVVIIYRKST
jgi:hypothetical protein